MPLAAAVNVLLYGGSRSELEVCMFSGKAEMRLAGIGLSQHHYGLVGHGERRAFA